MSTTTAGGERRPGRLPEAIVRKMRRVIRRLRVVLLLRGLLAVTAVAIGALLAAMAVDAAVMILSNTGRWLLSGGVFAAIATAAAWFLVRPLARSFTLAGIARIVEAHHPELEERISSAIELLSSSDAPELRGSDALIAELTKEASVEVRAIVPEREVSARSVRPYGVAASAVAVVLIALFLLWPGKTSRLLARAVVPTADLGNLAAFDLSVSPGDVVLPPGSPLSVEATIADPSVEAAELRRIFGDGTETTQPMESVAGSGRVRRFVLTAPVGDTSFRYRVVAGRAVSEYFDVTVTPLPVVEHLTVRYDYPAYTKLPPEVDDDATGDIAAVAGTKITLTATANKPLASAELRLNGEAVPGGERKNEPDAAVCTWSFVLEPGAGGRLSLALEDRYGLAGRPLSWGVKVLPDRKPTVVVTEPAAREWTLRPTDRLPVYYRAEDDYGIAAAHLLIAVDGKRRKPLPLAPPSARPGEPGLWAGRATLDLAALDLGRARTLTFRVRVSDTLPASRSGPQHGTSQTFTIHINRSAPSYTDQQVAAGEKEIHRKLTGILRHLRAAKQQAAALPRAVARKGPLGEPAAKLAGGVRKHVGDAEDAMRRLAARTQASPFAAVAKKLTDTADRHVVPARKAAERVQLADRAEQRVAHAKTADRHVTRAIGDVQNMLDELKKISERIRLAAKLGELAERERELARAAQNMEKEKAALPPDGRWKKDQDRLAKDLAKTVTQAPKAKHQALEQERDEAKRIARQADQLAGQQKDLEAMTRRAARAPADDELKKQLVRRIAEAQKQIAKETRELARKIDRDTPPPDATHRAAADSTQQAADQLNKNQLARAAQTSEQAARQLGDLAKNLTPKSDASRGARDGASPQSGDREHRRTEHAGQASRLARQQKALSRQIQALARGDLDQALALMQKDVAKRAAQLADRAKQLEAEAQNLQLARAEQARNAAGELANAAENADQAAAKLQPQAAQVGGQQGQPGQQPQQGQRGGRAAAAQNQQRAAAAMQNAARALQALARSLAPQTAAAQLARQAQRAGQPSVNAQELAQAHSQATRAAQAQTVPVARQAAQAAAQSLLAAARQAARQAGMPSTTAGQTPTMRIGGLVNDRVLTPDLKVVQGSDRKLADRLQALGFSAADWTRLPDNLKSRILQAAGHRAPEEYRELIRRYFRDLARRGRNDREEK